MTDIEKRARDFYAQRFVTAFGDKVNGAGFTPLQITSGTFVAELAAFGEEMYQLGYGDSDKEWRESQRHNGYNEGNWSV